MRIVVPGSRATKTDSDQQEQRCAQANTHDALIELSAASVHAALEPSSRDRYANVTIFLRARHQVVTPACNRRGKTEHTNSTK
jgi:hypothetical protein